MGGRVDAAAVFLRDLVAARIAVNDPAAYRCATLAAARFWPGSALKRIACPALIIAGDADRVVPGVYRARLRKALPHTGYVPIPGGGHACNIDHADEVNAALLEFLNHV